MGQKSKPSKHKSKKKQDHRAILIPPAALAKLLKLPTPHNTNCIALYLFYLKKAVQDKTNRIWCNDSYVAGSIGDDGERKGLKWAVDRVKRTRQQLIKLGYIEVIQSHDKQTGHFDKKYIEVKFFPSKMAIEKEQYLSVLDEYAEEFTYWVNYFTTQRMRDEVKIAKLEKQIADCRKLLRSVKIPGVTESSNLTETVKCVANAYRKEDRKAYRKQSVAGKPATKRVSTSSCLEEGINKKTFDEKCVIKLENLIRSKRNIFRKVNRSQWTRHFKNFRVKSEVKKRRIKEVLLWYIRHFGEDFVPKAYSAKSFCDKFLNIEDAMERSMKKAEMGQGIAYRIVRRKKAS